MKGRWDRLQAAATIKQVNEGFSFQSGEGSETAAGHLLNISFVQYFADVAEADSWLSDRKPLLSSDDRGKDESSTTTLLQRYLRLEKEMMAYGPEIKRLSEQAKSAAQLTALTVSVND